MKKTQNNEVHRAGGLQQVGSPVPTLEVVKIYFSEKGISEGEAISFFAHFQGCKWRGRNGQYVNWKQAAYQWMQCYFKKHPWLFRRYS